MAAPVNILEQDLRAIKRVTRPMFTFTSPRCTGNVLAGLELMHMIHKKPFAIDSADDILVANQFYALAAQDRLI
ncbi:integrase [Janthinobacterium sp. 1_2014MBL_MicDiv]|nr:integrase [Janthinobacterium sp. 1_2014MBL_MicDiv]